MSTHRGHNEGSISKRKDKAGNVIGYEVRISIPGEGRKSFYTKTHREAQALRKEKLAELHQGKLTIKEKPTLGEYLTGWLQTVQPSVRPLTSKQYAITVKRVTPHLGKLRLDALKPAHVQDCYTALLASGLSARSVQQSHTVLHKALGDALRLDLVQRNVTEAVSPPRPARQERPALSPEQLDNLFEATEGDRFHALWVLLSTAGLRIGEALGLKWSDIDFSKRTLVVRRALQRQMGAGLVFVDTKSATSRRTVELMDIACGGLRAHQDRQDFERKTARDVWQEHSLVFPSEVGTPVELGRVHKHFKQGLAKAGIPDVRIHDLRHTAATLMAQQGAHLRVVQEMLGHSSFTLTAATYSHVSATMQREAVDRVDALFSYRQPGT